MANGFQKLGSAVTDLLKASGNAAKEAPKLGMGTARLGAGVAQAGGKAAIGTASVGAGLAGGIIGTVAKIAQKHPKLTFLAGLYGAIKLVQSVLNKNKDAREARAQNDQQVFNNVQPYGQEQSFGAPAAVGAQQFGGQQFDAPRQPQPEISQEDLVRQVMQALETAQSRQAGGQQQPEAAQSGFQDRVRPGAAAPEAGGWRQTVDANRQAQPQGARQY